MDGSDWENDVGAALRAAMKNAANNDRCKCVLLVLSPNCSMPRARGRTRFPDPRMPAPPTGEFVFRCKEVAVGTQHTTARAVARRGLGVAPRLHDRTHAAIDVDGGAGD